MLLCYIRIEKPPHALSIEARERESLFETGEKSM